MPTRDDKWKLTKKWTMREVNKLKIPLRMGYGVTYDKSAIDEMSLHELADLSQYLQDMYKRRVREAKKTGVTPYGIIKLQNEYNKQFDDIIDVNGKKMSIGEALGINLDSPITKGVKGSRVFSQSYANMRYARQSLEGYINSMLNFFSWKSSTVKGWEAITKAQDIRLFGVDEKGAPLKRMSDEQRTKFWSAIDELRKRSTNALDYEHSEPLVTANWLTLFDENADINWNDPTSLMLAMEKIINGEELIFPEYDGTGNKDGATPFGEVVGLERRGDDVWQ